MFTNFANYGAPSCRSTSNDQELYVITKIIKHILCPMNSDRTATYHYSSTQGRPQATGNEPPFFICLFDFLQGLGFGAYVNVPVNLLTSPMLRGLLALGAKGATKNTYLRVARPFSRNLTAL